ncbi:hypothetical protein HK405_015855, partial [Cladochytrium tenue]
QTLRLYQSIRNFSDASADLHARQPLKSSDPGASLAAALCGHPFTRGFPMPESAARDLARVAAAASMASSPSRGSVSPVGTTNTAELAAASSATLVLLRTYYGGSIEVPPTSHVT